MLETTASEGLVVNVRIPLLGDLSDVDVKSLQSEGFVEIEGQQILILLDQEALEIDAYWRDTSAHARARVAACLSSLWPNEIKLVHL